MATDQTDAEPPNRGNTMFVNMGCTANSNAALRKIAAVKSGISKTEELVVSTEASTRSLTDIRVTLLIRSGGVLLQREATLRKPIMDRTIRATRQRPAQFLDAISFRD